MEKSTWFKAKRYGWGWYPATWQGWLLLIVYIALIVGTFMRIDRNSHSVSDTLIVFVPLMAVYSVALIIICYLTGEEPRWRWGNK